MINNFYSNQILIANQSDSIGRSNFFIIDICIAFERRYEATAAAVTFVRWAGCRRFDGSLYRFSHRRIFTMIIKSFFINDKLTGPLDAHDRPACPPAGMRRCIKMYKWHIWQALINRSDCGLIRNTNIVSGTRSSSMCASAIETINFNFLSKESHCFNRNFLLPTSKDHYYHNLIVPSSSSSSSSLFAH